MSEPHPDPEPQQTGGKLVDVVLDEALSPGPHRKWSMTVLLRSTT